MNQGLYKPIILLAFSLLADGEIAWGLMIGVPLLALHILILGLIWSAIYQ